MQKILLFLQNVRFRWHFYPHFRVATPDSKYRYIEASECRSTVVTFVPYRHGDMRKKRKNVMFYTFESHQNLHISKKCIIFAQNLRNVMRSGRDDVRTTGREDIKDYCDLWQSF